MTVKNLVVVGGGVAGVCCVEELDALLNDGQTPSTSENKKGECVEWKIVFLCGQRGFIKVVSDAKKVRFVFTKAFY